MRYKSLHPLKNSIPIRQSPQPLLYASHSFKNIRISNLFQPIRYSCFKMLFQLSLLFLLGTAVSALPNPALSPAQACKNVNTIIDVLQLYPKAASFCSSFISIPIVTSTSTQTIGTTTVYTATTTNTLTQSTVVSSTL